jgi:Na+-translocating ferredoxin:NAD+ oxidoreductase RnfD subunit
VVLGRKKQSTAYALVYIFQGFILLSLFFSLTNLKLSRQPNNGRDISFFFFFWLFNFVEPYKKFNAVEPFLLHAAHLCE